MLNEIRRLFRESIEAFRSELGAREPEDQVAELLMAMRRELVAAKAALPEYAEDIARTESELGRERELVAQCERRAEMAERIGDAETMRIAKEFGQRHAEKVLVLEHKLTAARAELALRRREAEEMATRYKEADANRFALLAQVRTASTRKRMHDATDSGAFAEFGRMEERVERGVDSVDARIELDAELSPGDDARQPPANDVEERLRALKRRMGRDA